MNPAKQLVAYVRSSKAELEKVAWPTKQDVFRYSTLIVVVSLVAAVFFALLDNGLQSGIRAVILRKAPVTATTEPTTIPADSLQVTPEITAEPVPASTGQGTTNVITDSPTR